MMYCFYRPCGTDVFVYCVYRPCGADMLCFPSLVPKWLICRVYCPCGADVLWLPSLWGWCIFLCLPFSFSSIKGQTRVNVFINNLPSLVPGGPMICCVYRPSSLRGWCVVVMSTIPVWSMCSIYCPYGTRCSHYHRHPEGPMMGCVYYRPCGAEVTYVLSTVPRPWGADVFYLYPKIFKTNMKSKIFIFWS